MTKIDLHVHCAPQRRELSGQNPYLPQANYLCGPEELVETLNTQGITAAVLMSSGEAEGDGLTVGNAACADICRRYPTRLRWMCNLDPCDPAEVYDRLAACRAAGAIGVGELMVNQWLDSPFLSAVFAAAEELGLPVTFHMSPEPGYNYGVCDRPGLPLLEEVLRAHPRLAVVGHSQPFWTEISAGCPTDPAGRNGNGRGPVTPGGRLEQLLEQYPNLYCDLSAYSGFCALTRDEAYGATFVQRFAGRLLYATDCTNRYTVPPLGQTLERWLAEGRIGPQAAEQIFARNAARLYAPAFPSL